jgi:hypothetical protein
MRWAINVSRENQKIKIILEGIDFKSVAKHMEKIPFQTWATFFQNSRDFRIYSAKRSEDATNHPSELLTEFHASKLKGNRPALRLNSIPRTRRELRCSSAEGGHCSLSLLSDRIHGFNSRSASSDPEIVRQPLKNLEKAIYPSPMAP